ALAFGLWEQGNPVCVCTFWNGARFRDAAIGTLSREEMAMGDLLSATSRSGRGLASIVIAYAEAQLREAGYRRLVTWVWHTNGPSIRTFQKARWTSTALVVEVFPLGRTTARRLRWRTRPGV